MSNKLAVVFLGLSLGCIVVLVGKAVNESKTAEQELSTVYSDRAEHVKETCDKYKPAITARYHNFRPKESYISVLGRAEVLINKKSGFLWCRVPKAASESWSGVFVKKWYE